MSRKYPLQIRDGFNKIRVLKFGPGTGHAVLNAKLNTGQEKFMGKIKLALLSGGVSSEREVSLNSGRQVYDALNKDKYEILQYDPKTDLVRLVQDAPGLDAALIILHGPFGEDGTVQGLLDLLDIPYQGAGVLGSAMAMNKLVTKQLYKTADIPTPDFLSLTLDRRCGSERSY